MEVDEIQTQACKFSRGGNGRNESIKIGQKGSDNFPDNEEDRELVKRGGANGGGGGVGAGGGVDDTACTNSLRGWHHSSRIIRVSRASGGKDRHSKVWTSKGLRDRRVRLSVNTAIQFYDLQDRLGYDQPSKAVEWLIKAADDAIAELPSLNSSFPHTPKQLSDEKRASEGIEQGFDSAEVEFNSDPNNYPQNQSQQHLSLSKSACSSTSETSKNSGLSLSRSGIRGNRLKARERARERAAKEKEKEQESRIASHQNLNPISQHASFTELLISGIGNVSNNNTSPMTSAHQNPNADPDFFHKVNTARLWPVTQTDYFSPGLLGPSSSSASRSHHSSGFPGQIQLVNSLPQPISIPPFTVSGENHQELQPFSFVPNPDHPIPVATTQTGPVGGDYNLNFTISSGLAGFNRGTLQSNSPFLPHHLQMYSSIDRSLYIGTPPVENHHNHQFSAGLDGRLHFCYGDGSRSSDQKGKGKN